MGLSGRNSGRRGISVISLPELPAPEQPDFIPVSNSGFQSAILPYGHKDHFSPLISLASLLLRPYRLRAPRSCLHRLLCASDGRSPERSYPRSDGRGQSGSVSHFPHPVKRWMEMRCRSPPESSQPFSPILVFHPSGSFSANSSTLASFAAAST